MPGGRKKTVINTKRIERLAAQGLTKDQIIRVLDVGESTFYRCLRESSELAVAFERGRAAGVEKVAKMVMDHHIMKSKNFDAAKFYLKTQAKWKEDSDVTVKGDKDNPVQVEENVTTSLNIPALSAEALEVIGLALQRKAADDAKGKQG